jgi:AcrR family transcriptional regulator
VPTSQPGLRRRKREQTSLRIQAAAVALVLRDGPEAATIDAISERAEISPRTFFNYFDSKDSAVLGIRPTDTGERALVEELSEAAGRGEDPIGLVIRLVVSVMGIVTPAGTAVHRERVKVIRRHPEILTSHFAQLHARKHQLSASVAEILGAHPSFQASTGLEAEASMVLGLGAAAVRTALDEWARASRSEEQRVEERAVELARRLVERLR